jgi:hypothetical protein
MVSPLESDSLEAECLEWVKRGEWDWRSAHLLAEAKSPVLETACFHAQQAVEKILKAFLVSRGRAVPRTHNLVALLDGAVELEPELAWVKRVAVGLWWRQKVNSGSKFHAPRLFRKKMTVCALQQALWWPPRSMCEQQQAWCGWQHDMCV